MTTVSQAYEPGGLVSHDMRQLVWPKLLGISRFDVTEFRQHLAQPHPSADQIMRDVDRSMWHLHELGSRSKKKRRGGRRRLLSDVRSTSMHSMPFQCRFCVCLFEMALTLPCM